MSANKSKTILRNKRCIVFGGAGSIGSELVVQLAQANKVYIVDTNESALFDLTDSLKGDVWGRVGDIRDYKTIQDVFADFKPQIVFNAAALKHVPLMEYTPLEAIQTNVLGHYNLIHVAKTWECLERFIYISTDKVVSSNSIMGATKRLGEVITKNMGGIVVRFGNVMGSRGSLLTIWQRQMDRGEPLIVTHEDMERYMMSIPEAVKLVLEATENGKPGEIWVMEMKKKHNIKRLAEKIIAETNYENGFEITGIRPGETLSEEIMFAEERARAVKRGSFWVL